MSPRPPSTSKAAASGLPCPADDETRRVRRGSRQEVTTAVRSSRDQVSGGLRGEDLADGRCVAVSATLSGRRTVRLQVGRDGMIRRRCSCSEVSAGPATLCGLDVGTVFGCLECVEDLNRDDGGQAPAARST
jgi:hypothetical protein